MNDRILALIENSEMLQKEDLELLSAEIQARPYLQSVRALQLLATSRFDVENYQKILSATAAYTTDKKNLYQLINGKSQPQEVALPVENTVEESQHELSAVPEIGHEETQQQVEIAEDDFAEVSPGNESVTTVIKEFGIEQTAEENTEAAGRNGEPLKEVEDEILEEKQDYENAMTDETDAGTPEMIIEEQQISQEAPLVEDASVLSFHGTQDFMPEVVIGAGKPGEKISEPKKTKESRHEEEMRRLIEEVERKMKENKAKNAPKPVEEDEPASTEISFSENMEMNEPEAELVAETVSESDVDAADGNLVMAKETTTVQLENSEQGKLAEAPEKEWVPMNITGNTPDSIIKMEGIKAEAKPEQPVGKMEEKQPETVSEEKSEDELPVMNVSFFSQDITQIESDEKAAEQAVNSVDEEVSNVPQFINTWQSWLKIDRTESVKQPEPKENSKEEVKEKAIEKFIETEPKISQLKEESSYVVKEKKGDISHLMTETLAKIYTEQKLYTKAIKAYETLSQKHPEKADYFAGKIDEVKEIRSNSNQS